MISITCTNCRTELIIDDAFAGGVCRCQHCGTIQTVPAHLKGNLRPASQGTPTSKTLYQNQGRAHSDAEQGLDGLAEAVASSGLGSRRLRSGGTATQARQAPATAAPRKSPLVLLIAGGALLLGLIAFGVIYLIKGSTSPAPTIPVTPDNTGDTSNAPAAVVGPSFCGVPLTEQSVVYVIDRGGAEERSFDSIKAALFHSLESLGPDKKFAVILTSNGADDFAFPLAGLADASAASITKIRAALDDVVANGASTFRSAVDKAILRHPADIVFVTAKFTVEEDDAAALRQNALRGVRINTFAIGDTPATAALEEAASRSNGTFRRVSEEQLRKFGS